MATKWDSLQSGNLSRKLEFRKLEFVEASKNSMQHGQKVSASADVNIKKDGEGGEKTTKPKTSLFEASIADKYLKWNKVSRVGPGFFNDGNTCYLNSTLQCLVHTPPLAQILLHEPKEVMKALGSNDANESDRNPNQKVMRPVLHHFHSLINDVWRSNSNRALAPRGMIASIRRVGKQFKPLRQEDAHEYLRQLLDCMHEEILKAKGVKTSDGKIAETSMFSRVFGGYLCNTLTCSKCNFASKTFNHFQDLSLDINQGIRSVSEAVATFTKPEYLTAGNEWKCDKCKQKVKAKKQMTLHQLPNILVMQLKRFSFGNMFAKITKPIQFKEVMYLEEDGHHSHKESSDKHHSAESDKQPQGKRVRYELYGVIVHHGHSTHSGHYIAYVKAANGVWHEMNDSHVSVVSINTVLSCQAYILFYARCRSTPSAEGASPAAAAATNLANLGPATLVRTSANGTSTVESAGRGGDNASDTTTTGESSSASASDSSSPRGTPPLAGEGEDLGEVVSQKRKRSLSSDSISKHSKVIKGENETKDSSDEGETSESDDDSTSTSSSGSDEEEDDDADDMSVDPLDVSRRSILPPRVPGVFRFVGAKRFGKWKCRKILPIREYVYLLKLHAKDEIEELRHECVVKEGPNVLVPTTCEVIQTKAITAERSVPAAKAGSKAPHAEKEKQSSSGNATKKEETPKKRITPEHIQNSNNSAAPQNSKPSPVVTSHKSVTSDGPVSAPKQLKVVELPPRQSASSSSFSTSTITSTSAAIKPTPTPTPAAVPSSSGSTGAASASSKPAQSSTLTIASANAGSVDVVKKLMEQGIRGRDAGGEGMWETVSPQLAAKVQEISTNQRRLLQKEKKARKSSEWNAALDAGKVKKVKVPKEDVNAYQPRDSSGKLINPFQNMADVRNKEKMQQNNL